MNSQSAIAAWKTSLFPSRDVVRVLNETAYNQDHDDAFRCAKKLFDSVTALYYELGRNALLAMITRAANRFFLEACCKLLESRLSDNSSRAANALQHAASDKTCGKRFSCLLILFKYSIGQSRGVQVLPSFNSMDIDSLNLDDNLCQTITQLCEYSQCKQTMLGILRAIANLDSHPGQISAAILLVEQGDIDQKQKLETFAQDLNHVKLETAVHAMLKSKVKDVSDIGKAVLIRVSRDHLTHSLAFLGATYVMKITSDPDNLQTFQRAKSQWSSMWNDYHTAASVLYGIAMQSQHHDRQFEAARCLWHSVYSRFYDPGADLLRRIASNSAHSHCIMAATELMNSTISMYRLSAITLVVNIVRDKHHPKAFDAAELLCNHSVAEYSRLEAKPVLYHVCVDSSHPKAWQATTMLWSKFDHDSIARDVLSRYVSQAIGEQNVNLPHAIDAALLLWEGDKDDRKHARAVLYLVLDTPDHTRRYAICELFLNVGDRDDIMRATNVLHELIQTTDLTHRDRWIWINKLWTINHPGERDYLRPVLVDIIVRSQDGHLILQALTLLWHEESRREEDHIMLRAMLVQFAENTRYQTADRHRAIALLRESLEAEDHEVGLRLLVKLFPEQIKIDSNTETTKAMYQWPVIHQYMPQPLEDLSSDKTINIVTGFGKILQLMIDHHKKPTSPYHISIEAITGEKGDSRSLDTAIKPRVLGFLKALTNQRLGWGEVGGWMMHDENKPAMVNSLKHLLRHMERDLAIPSSQPQHREVVQAVMISAGIVFNAILHCPTGQAEGIDSAVNFLIREQNTSSTDIKVVIGEKVISVAVQKAFRQAFHNGGGVHNISRARLVLGPEIGLHHAITDFKERISPVADCEIPLIMQKYYEVFTLPFLLAELRRNIPTRDEQMVILNAHQSRAHADLAKMTKVNKPISLGMLIAWLHDQGESEEQMKNTTSGYGIADDFQGISDQGLMRLMVKMGFLSELALPVIDQHFRADVS